MHKGVTLCQKEVELQMFQKLIATLWKQGTFSGECLGKFIHRHHVMPREQLYVPKGSSFPMPSKYVYVVRQTKTDLDKSEECIIDDLWNIDGNTVLSEKRIGFTSFRIVNKRPPNGYSGVGG